MSRINIFVIFIFCSFIFAKTANAQASQKPDILLLMHNPSGIRVEFNISKQQLELWISPQAGKEDGYWMRNFSNRDDHTRLFDAISFPELKPSEYVNTEYNPWHSVVNYKTCKLHIATVFDQPYLMLWFEGEGMVDFKSDKQDSIVKRTKNTFHIHHPDRGLDFSFVALLSEGNFRHQLQTDRGRSTYARAYLKSNSPLYIGGELSHEPVEQMLISASKITVKNQMAATKATVDKILENGQVVFRDNDKMQELIDFNKRIWVSSQDHSGALHASIQAIYYLIWVREGGLACPWMSYSGWLYPMEKWLDYQMKNPTEIHDEGPRGRFFGQLANGKITKWQEDGAFYVIWNAFTHWTQTGSKKYVSNENLDLLKESVQWLEKYCFDDQRGLFYRYYYCETPLYNSRDYGWDNAVGKPVLGWDPDLFQGQKLEKSYDIYINMLNFSVYKMLEAMCNAQGLPNNYGTKAAGLAEKMKFMFVGNDLPLYGEVITTEGKTLTAKKYEIDRTDYIWALTCPPFYPQYLDMDKYRKMLFDNLVKDPDHNFLAGYFSILGSLNLAGTDQQEVRKAIDYAAKECYIPWENLPMAGSMVEMSGYYPPGSAHQIRPQMFTMGAWFGAMGNLGVKRLPYGLAVQPAQLINCIKSYAYNDKVLNFRFSGNGNVVSYSLNGKVIKGSLQIPEQKLVNGNNTIEVKVSNVVNELPLLLNSTMKLNSIDNSNEKISYHFESLNAENSLTLSLTGNPSKIQLKNTKGKSIKFNTKPLNKSTYQVNFSYKGSLVLEVKK